MNVEEILNGVEDQSKGRWFELLHPVTGAGTAIRLRVIGPDSRGQAEALAMMTDELADAADDVGRVSGRDRERIRQQFLARCVVEVEIDAEPGTNLRGQALILRLLGVAWVRAQVDTFAINRAVYFAGAADAAV